MTGKVLFLMRKENVIHPAERLLFEVHNFYTRTRIIINPKILCFRNL